MEIDGDKVTFSTGKIRDANRGIIGLSPDMGVTEGYDGGFYNPDHDEMHQMFGEDDLTLTPDEQIELADYMIALWCEFRRIAQGKKATGTSP